MNEYKKILNIYKKIYNLNHLSEIASWDQITMMPKGSNNARVEALTEFHVLLHKLKTSPLIGELIEKSLNLSLSKNELITINEIKKNYDLLKILPKKLIKRKTDLTLKCEYSWRQQRINNDWKGFLKYFSEVVAIVKEEAMIRSEYLQVSAYDALIGIHEPEITSIYLDNLFGQLKTWLPALIEKVIEKQKNEPDVIIKTVSNIDERKILSLYIMKKLGFDFNKGRLDLSTHGMCIGVPEDVRITTRLDETNFLKSLMVTMHETGHALYEQNLPYQYVSLPSGRARSMGIHESQSLLFEMQLGRDKNFLQSIYDELIHYTNLEKNISVENLHNFYTRVRKGYIRVDADEVTYPMHIILRYEIEKDLINGKIGTKDIPDIWESKLFEYLGLRLNNNLQNGPLQDIHWAQGIFGYFPSYILGSMYASQMYNKIKKTYQNIDSDILCGRYSKILFWLDQNIWKNASLVSTDELIKNATGEKLEPNYFKTHLYNRYL